MVTVWYNYSDLIAMTETFRTVIIVKRLAWLSQVFYFAWYMRNHIKTKQKSWQKCRHNNGKSGLCANRKHKLEVVNLFHVVDVVAK